MAQIITIMKNKKLKVIFDSLSSSLKPHSMQPNLCTECRKKLTFKLEKLLHGNVLTVQSLAMANKWKKIIENYKLQVVETIFGLTYLIANNQFSPAKTHIVVINTNISQLYLLACWRFGQSSINTTTTPLGSSFIKGRAAFATFVAYSWWIYVWLRELKELYFFCFLSRMKRCQWILL